jgi:hypothetical protein
MTETFFGGIGLQHGRPVRGCSPPAVAKFCEDWQVDQGQEHELRTWAEALCRSPDSERRAMGKAIEMLLGEIETAKERLERPPRVFRRRGVRNGCTSPASQGSADTGDDLTRSTFGSS